MKKLYPTPWTLRATSIHLDFEPLEYEFFYFTSLSKGKKMQDFEANPYQIGATCCRLIVNPLRCELFYFTSQREGENITDQPNGSCANYSR